jgi:hypothetical protein
MLYLFYLSVACADSFRLFFQGPASKETPKSAKAKATPKSAKAKETPKAAPKGRKSVAREELVFVAPPAEVNSIIF